MRYTGEGIMVTNLIWDLTSDIVIALIGMFWFGEEIQGLRWLALTLSFMSLGLFAYTSGDRPKSIPLY
jgi:multidrug transporter EmrE-like cation transporter